MQQLTKDNKLNSKTNNTEIWLIILIIFVIVASLSSVIIAVAIENKSTSKVSIKEVTTSIPVTSTPNPTSNINTTETPIPTATPIPEIPMHIKSYIQKNSDTIGYINIEGTVINYPVMYSGDNEFYLHNDFNKQHSYYGAIFMDYRCDVYNMPKTRNVILYGHRMRDGSMFRSLVYYFEKDFFDGHKIIQFDTLACKMQWEVFSIYESHIDFYYIKTEFENDDSWLEFINYCQELSLYKTDIELEKDDIVLTLSTCSTDKNHRVVVMARLIEDN